MSLVLTGAGGQLGRVLRPRLLARGIPLRAVDIAPLTATTTSESTITGDLRDADVIDRALDGATAILHLAGTSVERPLPEIIENNLIALHALYEGARRHRIQRIVFASSNHTIGMYPAGHKLRLSDPYRPDGFYGISKIWGEAIGRLYWDKYGIEGVALRIGSALPRPTEPRHLATWLGHDDLEHLVLQSLTAPISQYLPVWGVSANTASCWDNGEAAELGYHPTQNAADYAAEIAAHGGRVWRFQGGGFAED